MIQRFEKFVTSVSQLYRCIQKIKSREMTELGLKGTHVMCLFHLRQNTEGLTASQLSTLCMEDKAAISRAISKLEEKGLVRLAQSGEKRRYRAPITLTQTGQSASQRMVKLIEDAVTRGGAGLTESERNTFYNSLDIITRNLQAMCAQEANA